MSQEVYERIRAGLPDVKEDIIKLVEKGELTEEEYWQLVEDFAPYVDPTRGALSEDTPLIEVKPDE